jgi:hypothetical protein
MFEEDSTYGTQTMNIVPDGIQRSGKSKKKEAEVLNQDEEEDDSHQMGDPNMYFETNMADEYGNAMGKKKKKKKKKKNDDSQTERENADNEMAQELLRQQQLR